MARIRTIKPAFFSSLSNADLPIPTRMTWIGLWTYVDDKGRAVDDARLVKAAVWPLDDAYTAKKVESDLAKLEKAGKIGRYIVDGQRYLAVVNWRTHQRIDKPQPSTIPGAPWEKDSGNVPGKPPPDSRNVPGTPPPKDGGEVEGKGIGREGNGSGREGNTPSSSSSLNRVGPATADDDDDGQARTTAQVVAQVVSLIADQRIATSATPIANHRAYRSKVLPNVDADHGDEAQRLALAGHDPAAIAEMLEPPPVAPASMSPYPDAGKESKPVFDEVWDDEAGEFRLIQVPA